MSRLTRAEAAAAEAVRDFSGLLAPVSQTPAARVVEAANTLASNPNALREISYTSAGASLVERIEELALDLRTSGRSHEAERQLSGLLALAERATDFGGLSPAALRILLRTVKTLLHHSLEADLLLLVKATGLTPAAQSKRQSQTSAESHSAESSQSRQRQQTAYQRIQALLKLLLHAGRDARPLSPPAPVIPWSKLTTQQIADDYLSDGRLPEVPHIRLVGGGSEPRIEDALTVPELACPWDAFDGASVLPAVQQQSHAGAGVGFTIVMTFQLEDLRPPQRDEPYIEVVNMIQIDERSPSSHTIGPQGPPLVGLAASIIRRPNGTATVMQLHYTTTSFAFAEPSAKSGRMPPNASTTVVFGTGGEVGRSSTADMRNQSTETPFSSTGNDDMTSRPLVLVPNRTYSLLLAHAAPPLAPAGSSDTSSSSRLPSKDMHTPVSLYLDGELIDVRRSVWPRVRPSVESQASPQPNGNGIAERLLRAEFGGTPVVSPLPPKHVNTASTSISTQSAADSEKNSERTGEGEPSWALRLYTPLYILRVHLPTSPLPSVGAGPDSAFLIHQLLLPSSYTAHGHTHESSSPASAGASGSQSSDLQSRHGSTAGLGRFLTYAGSMRINLRLDERSVPQLGSINGTNPNLNADRRAYAEKMSEHALRERRRRLVYAVAGSASDMAPPAPKAGLGTALEGANGLSPSGLGSLITGKGRKGRASSSAAEVDHSVAARFGLDFWGERQYGMYLSLDFASPRPQSAQDANIRFNNRARRWNSSSGTDTPNLRLKDAWIERRSKGTGPPPRHLLVQLCQSVTSSSEAVGAIPVVLELLRLSSWVDPTLITPVTSDGSSSTTASSPPVFVLLLDLLLLIIGGETSWRTSEEAERTGAWEVLKLVLERNARLIIPKPAGQRDEIENLTRGWAASESSSIGVLRLLFEASGRRYVLNKSGSEPSVRISASASATHDEGTIMTDDSTWALVNPLLYRLILLDPRTFRFCAPAVRRQHLLHFQALLRDSDYKSFNVRRVAKMGIMRRLLSAWNARLFDTYRRITPRVQTDFDPKISAQDDSSLEDEVVAAVFTILKVQANDSNVRTITAFLATASDSTNPTPFKRPRAHSRAATARSINKGTDKLAIKMLSCLFDVLKERPNILLRLSASADVRWLVPILAGWRFGAVDVDSRSAGSSELRSENCQLLKAFQTATASNQAGELIFTRGSRELSSLETSTKYSQPALHHRAQSVKIALELLVLLCSTSMRQALGPQDGSRYMDAQPAQRNYADRLNAIGGFRSLQSALAPEWSLPGIQPLCWAMLFGLPAVPAPTQNVLDNTNSLVETFGPPRYTTVRNPRALRLILACWSYGLIDLLTNPGLAKPSGDLSPAGQVPMSQLRQGSRLRRHSMHVGRAEQSCVLRQQILEDTVILLEQHCDCNTRREEFREIIFNPTNLRILMDALLLTLSVRSASLASAEADHSLPERLASRVLNLLARLVTDSIAATNSLDVVEALLSAIPPEDVAERSALRCAVLEAILRSMASSIGIDLQSQTRPNDQPKSDIAPFFSFSSFIAQCSEELLSGSTLSSSLLLRLQSGLSEKLIRPDENAQMTSSAVKQRAKTRSLLLSSMIRVHYVQLASDKVSSCAFRSILDQREWLFGPENTDTNFFQCVLNRAFHGLRYGAAVQDRDLSFQLLSAVTLARPAVAEAGLLLEYSAADILQSSPESVLDLFSSRPEKDLTNNLPYQDSWIVFVKSYESLRRAAHLDRVSRLRRVLLSQTSQPNTSRSSELKLKHWHNKMCQSEHARLSRFEQDAREVIRFAKKHQEAMFFDLHRCNSFLAEVDGRIEARGLDPTEGPRRMRKILHPMQAEAHGAEAFVILPEHNPELVAVSGGKSQRLQSNGNDASGGNVAQDNLSQPGRDAEQLNDGAVDDEDEKSGMDEQDDDKFRHVLRTLDRGDIIDDVFNTSRVVSIECRGTLAIIGRSKLYLLDDYFQRPNGELVNAWEAPAEERDAVVFAALPSSAVQRSTLLLQLDGEARTRKWSWEEIVACFRRTWLHRKTALELFFADGQSCLLVLPSAQLASRLHDSIRFRAPRSVRTAELALSGLSGTSSSSSGFRSRFNNAAAEAWRGRSNTTGALTQAWVENRISNFEYLMNLNSLSGRTYNDFTQYPVMPWILADYTSENLDLNNASIYRDLTLPMGAQSPARRVEVQERYEQLLEMSEDSNAAFHYGTFFSTATVVSAYLVRVRPYNHVLIALQGGSFDLADRTFASVGQAWLSASEMSRGDVRELTPEFFYLPEMFLNSNRFNFGTTQAGELIDNVQLPPWAKGDPERFVKLHREALESDYVSANLHSWIDLIFGWRSRGVPAIEAYNCFHPLSYETGVDLDQIESNLERQATAQAIHNFGQMPQQLFTAPHPQRWPRSDTRRTDRLSVEEYPWLMIPGFCPVQEIDSEVHTIDVHQGVPQAFGPFAIPLHDCEVLLSVQKDTRTATATRFTASQAPTLPTVTDCIIGAEITCVAGAGQGVFAVGAADGTITLCLVDRHGSQISTLNVLRGHSAPIQCIFASSEWSLLITSSTDGSVFLWSTNRMECLTRLPTAGSSTNLISVDKNHGFIATCSASVLSLWTINAEPLAELDIEHHGLGPISALAFLDADVLGAGRLAVIFTGHEGRVASWECVLDEEHGSRSVHHWVLRQQYVFERKDQRHPRRLGKVTAIVASKTRMLTGDAGGSLYQWSIPGSEEQARLQLNTEALLGGRCAACEKRFSVLETRRVCGGCGGTFCSACATAETNPQLKTQRFCSPCRKVLRTLPLV